MKKLGLLTTLLAAGIMAAGCAPSGGGGGGGGGGDTTLKPKNEEVAARAIEYTKTESLASVTRKTDLLPDTLTEIGRNVHTDEKTHETSSTWNNDYLYLTTKNLYQDRDTDSECHVIVSWTYSDASRIKGGAPTKVDDSHVSLYFNYSETEDFEFSFTANLACGKQTGSLSYKVTVKQKNIKLTELSLDDIYKVNAAGTDFDLVDSSTGYYKKNNDNFNFYCVETYGEVLYTAPDGDWALIGAGNRVLELFSGSARNLNTETFPALKVGGSVEVGAELGSYYGNCQVSFIFYINECDASKYEKPTGYASLTGSMFDGKKYFEGELMNGLFEANAKYVGNLRQDGSTKTADQLRWYRFQFDVEVDGKTLQVAYDYHVDPSSTKHPIFDEYQAKLGSLKAGDAVKIKGTVRFAGKTEKTYLNQDKGVWSIVPFESGHIA